MAKHRAARNRKGMLPNESRRRSLVTVDVGLLDKPGQELHHYIVLTRRLDSEWTHQVSYRGETWDLPSKVVERLVAQRASIIKEERSRRARERLEGQVAQVLAAEGQ